jgi:putative oxidoreductase
MLRRQVLLEAISALLILLFLYASLSKFLDFRTFTADMNNQPLPNAWTPFLIWFIPCTEIAAALALIFESTRLLGFYASLALMGLFTIYTIIILLHFFAYVPCSCGGVIKHLTWSQHLVLNLFFLGLSISGVLIQRNKSLKQPFITTKHSLV